MKPTNSTNVFWGFLFFAALSWQGQAVAAEGDTPQAKPEPVQDLRLHEVAARLGGRRVVQSLIAEGVDVNAKDPQGRTPALLALYEANLVMTDLLLENGADSTTPYMTAYTGDLKVVKRLLAKGAPVESFKGLTLLHAAAGGGRTDVIEFLIGQGYKATASTEDGERTPLHFAALRGHLKAAKVLLANGAAVDSGEHSPLSLASWALHKEMVEFLMSQGADINRGHTTPLHIAVQWWMPEVAELLLEAGADINVTDEEGKTPLYHAVVTIEWLTMVELLISHGADVNIWPENNQGNSPLYHAVANGWLEIAESFIAQGGDVNNGPQPALHIAVEGHSLEMAKLLLDAGAQINAQDEQGNTPLQFAFATGKLEIAKLLISRGADVSKAPQTALRMAVKNGSVDLAKLLIEAGADINARDEEGNTPLHHAVAVSSWSTDLAKLLIEAGADINAPDKQGATPLHLAVATWYLEMAELLVSKGADVSAINQQGKSPLLIAKATGLKGFVELLSHNDVKQSKE